MKSYYTEAGIKLTDKQCECVVALERLAKNGRKTELVYGSILHQGRCMSCWMETRNRIPNLKYHPNLA